VNIPQGTRPNGSSIVSNKRFLDLSSLLPPELLFEATFDLDVLYSLIYPQSIT